MKRLRILIRRLLVSFRYHLERWNISPNVYPRQIMQTRFGIQGIIFEVHNLFETNRVIFYDDEEDFLSKLLSDLREHDVFFDIGACIGLFSIHAAKRCKQVYAFEPDPEFREHLKRNVSINNLENLSVLPYAISDQTSTLTLFTDGANGKSPSLENNNFQNSIDVEARTLSELVLQGALPYPTVIKMDIEGAEILALRGMEELLDKDSPRLIFLELHPVLLTHFGSSSTAVLSILEEAGYRIRFKSQREEQVHYVFERDVPVIA